MARQRFIWPDIWKDPVFGRLTPEEKVFFIACFSLADDEGRLLADANSLRGEMFRFNDFSLNRVAKVRNSVVGKVDSVHLYTAQGQEYIALLRWSEYQKPKYPSPSKIPAPFLPDSPKIPGTLEEDSPTGRDGLGGVGKGRVGPSVELVVLEEDESNGPGFFTEQRLRRLQ